MSDTNTPSKIEYECEVCNFSEYFTKLDYHLMPEKCRRCLRPLRDKLNNILDNTK